MSHEDALIPRIKSELDFIDAELESSRASQLIDRDLSESLQEYLAFRHMYRNSYGFMLDQELIEPLVRRVSLVASEVRASLQAVIQAH